MAVGNVSSTKRHKQIVKMMVVVLGFFVLLAGPWYLSDIVLDIGGGDGKPMPAHTQLITRELAALMMFVNGWALPIVYASFNSGVKKRISSMLSCGSALCCWKRVEPGSSVVDPGVSAGAAISMY